MYQKKYFVSTGHFIGHIEFIIEFQPNQACHRTLLQNSPCNGRYKGKPKILIWHSNYLLGWQGPEWIMWDVRNNLSLLYLNEDIWSLGSHNTRWQESSWVYRIWGHLPRYGKPLYIISAFNVTLDDECWKIMLTLTRFNVLYLILSRITRNTEI